MISPPLVPAPNHTVPAPIHTSMHLYRHASMPAPIRAGTHPRGHPCAPAPIHPAAPPVSTKRLVRPALCHRVRRWPHLVVLTSELFGSRHLGQNYMFFDGGCGAVGTLLLANLLPTTFYAAAASPANATSANAIAQSGLMTSAPTNANTCARPLAPLP